MQSALRECIRILGPEWVSTSQGDLRDASTATFASNRLIPAIFEPLDRMTASGFYSYRLGIQAKQLLDPATPYGKFLTALKTALDPNHILAPGRYLAPAPVEVPEKRFATAR